MTLIGYRKQDKRIWGRKQTLHRQRSREAERLDSGLACEQGATEASSLFHLILSSAPSCASKGARRDLGRPE